MGGTSLGPEAGVAAMGGRIGAAVSDRRKLDAAQKETNTLSAMAGAFGGLSTAPLLGPLMIQEIRRPGQASAVRSLIPTVVASTLGFAVLFPVIGHTFLAVYELPSYELNVRHLLAGVGVGVLGAVLAAIVGIALKVLGPVTTRAREHPVATGPAAQVPTRPPHASKRAWLG